MDAIKAEIERKKALLKQVAAVAAPSDGPAKKKPKLYLKRGDLERLEEQLKTSTEDADANGTSKGGAASKSGSSSSTAGKASGTASSGSGANSGSSGTGSKEDTDDITLQLQLPEEEIRSRFRARGEPIRLFGETQAERLRRLKSLGTLEERTDGQRNDFQSLLENAERGLALELLARQAGVDEAAEERKKRKARELEGIDTTAVSPRLLDKEPDRCRSLVGVYFRRVLNEWERALTRRPDDEKRSAQGRLAAATQAQSAQYLKPFFRGLKEGTHPPDIMARVTEICMHMQDREYLKANESYLKLSIGNAAWPIGVTMVGIHERSAREKISSSQVAHALNDEAQRKWIQSIKRLMTFAQAEWPPDDLSKAIG
ncbi:Prp18 domain-containing protein [Zopfochytrium polystomum]|nr:Prp18 domain-containing protein [Zopfochytrium polystomum]